MKKLTFLSILTIFLGFQTLNAQSTHNLVSSLVNLKGTATLYHNWSSKSTQATSEANMEWKEGKLEKINSLRLEIPVKSLKNNTNTELMDQRTYEALKANAFPTIVFVLKNIKKLKQNKQKITLSAEGELTIAGKTKTVKLDLEGKVLDKNSLEITGSHKLKMTDYGITPPSFVAETLTVGDVVNIGFILNFAQK